MESGGPLVARGPAPESPRVRRREVVWTVLVTGVLWLTMSQLVIFVPLRLLVTLVHEAGHATTATLFGADVLSVTVNSKGGGLTLWRDADPGTFMRLATASAGYMGAAIVGAVMLEFTRRLRNGRVALLGLAAAIVVIAIAWVPWTTEPPPAARLVSGSSSGDGHFTVLVCVLATVVLAGLALAPWPRVRRTAVVVIATCLCLGAIEDMRQVLDLSRYGFHSDAASAAAITPLSSWMWSAIWFLTGLALCGAALWSVVSTEDG